jgi:hypothetical protein
MTDPIFDAYPDEPSEVVDLTGTLIRFELQFSPADEQASVVTKQLAPDTDPSLPIAISSNIDPSALLTAIESPPSLLDLPGVLQESWQLFDLPNVTSNLQNALTAAVGADNFIFTPTSIPQEGKVLARVVSWPQGGDILLLSFWLSPISMNVDLSTLIGYPWTPLTPAVTDAGVVKAGSGSGLGSGTYRYAVTALDGFGGETAVSGTAAITFKTSGHGASLSWPAALHAFGGYNIYRSRADGPGNVLYLAGSIVSGWNAPQPQTTILHMDSAPDSTLNPNIVVSTSPPWMPRFIFPVYVYPLWPYTPFSNAPSLEDAGLDGELSEGSYRYAVTALAEPGSDLGETVASPSAVIHFGQYGHTTNLSWQAIYGAGGGYNIYRSLPDQPGNALYLAGHVAQTDSATVYYADDVPDAGLDQNTVPPTGSQLPSGFSPVSIPGPLNHATFSVSADLDISLTVLLNSWPNAPVYWNASVLNPSIRLTGATRTWADIDQALQDIGNGLISFFTQGGYSLKAQSPQATAQGLLSQATNPSLPVNLTPIVNQIAQVQQTAASFGFLQCIASTDPESVTPLTLTMIHPLDPPPVAYDLQTMAAPGQPLFSQYSISTTQAQATPAGQLGVVGSGFPSVYQMGIGWTDTCSGTVTGSDVEWGFEGQATTVTHLSASANFQFTPFAPAVGGSTAPSPGPYVFRVRNSDDDPSTPLTTTPFSDPVTLWSVGVVDLLLDYQSNESTVLSGLKTASGTPPTPSPPQPSQGVIVGTASVRSDGTFSETVTIPPDAVPGPATLCAQILGQTVFCVPLTIVAEIRPLLRLVNPTTLTDLGTDVYSGNSLWVAGEGFTPQGLVSLYIDEIQNNPGLAQVGVGSQGTFICNLTWPALAPGNHTLLAVETVQGETIQGSLIVTEEQPLG